MSNLAFDSEVICRQVVARKAAMKKSVPSAVSLADAVTSISLTDTIKGSSALEVHIQDTGFALVESGFFDVNNDGRLDAIDVNYPESTPNWWRLTQVQLTATGAVTLVFIERPAAWLLAHHGPLKVSRAKATRAEFMAMLVRKVKRGNLRFVCHELTTPQPKATHKQTAAERKTTKAKGIHARESITIKGVQANTAQIREVNTAMRVAADLNASPKATKAMVCAGIGESTFRPVVNSLGYGGVFQGQVETGGHYFQKTDTAAEAECFLKGGKGFQAGGAMALAAANPGMSPGTIATKVEGSGEDGSFYDAYADEADAIIEAFGGSGGLGGGGGATYVKQFNFEVGTTENPQQSYWEAMQDRADDVKWALFIDGNTIYYDSEPTLTRQEPVAVIDRDDSNVVDWSMNWDGRHIATELNLTLVCEPFDYRAGEVFKLLGFGPASTGSTIKLPGRWLISEIQRDVGAQTSSFTLKQPEAPTPEPAAEIAHRSGAGADSSFGDPIGGDMIEDSALPGSIRDRVVTVAKKSAEKSSKNPQFYLYSQSGKWKDNVYWPDVGGDRSDCSSWVINVYEKAIGKSNLPARLIGGSTGTLADLGSKTSRPQPGDVCLYGTYPYHHAELYVGNGKTIGHGTRAVDYSTPKGPSGFAGYWTFGFLNEDGTGPVTKANTGGRIGYN